MLSAKSLETPKLIPDDQPLNENLVATITAAFDDANIDSVLWGDYLLIVFGVPSIVDVGITRIWQSLSTEIMVLGCFVRCAG